jgi:hypothetical protein
VQVWDNGLGQRLDRQEYIFPASLYNPRLKLYTQDLGLTNNGTDAVDGPVYLILEDIPAGVTLVNEARPTTCYAPMGSPYVFVLSKGTSLAPGATEVLHLAFSNPSEAALTYTPLVVSGMAGTP